MNKRSWAGGIAIAMWTASVLAQSPQMGHGMSAAEQAMMDSMDRMGAAMKAPMSGDPDRDFAAMMIPHHRGAIEMAEVELRYGKDPELKAMARKIIEDQKAEIAVLEKWLAARPK